MHELIKQRSCIQPTCPTSIATGVKTLSILGARWLPLLPKSSPLALNADPIQFNHFCVT